MVCIANMILYRLGSQLLQLPIQLKLCTQSGSSNFEGKWWEAQMLCSVVVPEIFHLGRAKLLSREAKMAKCALIRQFRCCFYFIFGGRPVCPPPPPPALQAGCVYVPTCFFFSLNAVGGIGTRQINIKMLILFVFVCNFYLFIFNIMGETPGKTQYWQAINWKGH